MIILLISGTPGTGKTTISNAIANKINSKVISLNQLVLSENLILSRDQKRESIIYDEEMVLRKTSDLIKSIKKRGSKFLIIESHFSDIIPEEWIDLIVILRCEPEILTERLKKRQYSNSKIIENVQSEILGNSVNFFLEKKVKKPIFEIDTSNFMINELRDEIIKILKNPEYGVKYRLGKIDWLEELYRNDQLLKYFDGD